MRAKDLELVAYTNGGTELRYTDIDGSKRTFPLSDLTQDGIELESFVHNDVYSFASMTPIRNYRQFRIKVKFLLDQITYITEDRPKGDPFGGWV